MKALASRARGLFGRGAVSAAVLASLGLATGAAPAAAQVAPQVMTQAGFDGLNVMRGTPDYVTTKLGRLHYWTYGEGPAVILLHQAPLFGVEFAKAQPIMAAKGFRTIAVDIPGYGFSQRPDHAPTGEEYAQALAVLMDHLGLKTASVFGTHTGASIALAFAVHQPKRLSCLVLQGLPVYSAEELSQKVSAPASDTRIYGDGRQNQAWWARTTGLYDFSQASPESLEWMLIGAMLSGNIPWYGESTGSTVISRAFDSAKALPAVTAPTLLISVEGDHLDASFERAVKLRPDFAVSRITGPHTIVTYDRAQLWADTVGGFLSGPCVKAGAR